MTSLDFRERLQQALGDSYKVEDELGGGGMSRVILATDISLGRRIVVKVLPPELAAEVNVERFKREIQLAAQLNHPHIVPLLSAGSNNGLLYFTMPFVEGESLRAMLVREAPLAIETALTLAREAADALHYAHARGIVHRDIKPENILLSGGHAVVTDFGIARAVSQASGAHALTSASITVGTAAYMSPEQASGEREIDGRSDTYSLSCVLFEMLSGAPPFTGPTQQAVIARRFIEAPPAIRSLRSDVPAWLDEAVTKGLATSPEQRFSTAREFAHALASTAPKPQAALPPTPSPIVRRRTIARIAGVIVLGAAAALAFRSFRDVGPGRDLAAVSPDSAVIEPATIAVMPFANLSADPENAYFADGMTEEVINALSGIEGLRVAARSSVFALRGKQLDVRMIGDTLGVSSILEGTVRRQGNRLRITAQLVSSRDGYQVWSDDYDRELSDVFQVQNEIARSIVTALRVKLIRPAGGPEGLAKPTGNAGAYDLYLKGLFLLHSQGVRAVRTALQHFEAALELDPDFARAHSGVAAARARLGVLAGENPAVELPLAKKSALRALQLDSSLAEAHVSLAHVLFVWEWNHREAERVFRTAISLDPDDADARWHYGISLLNQKRFDDAERQFRTAHDLEPLVPHTSSLLGRFFVATRQADSAIKYLKNAIELGPNLDLAYQQLGHAYLQKNMATDAIAAFAKAAELSGPRDSAHLAHAYAVTGNRRRADVILNRLLATASSRYLFPVDLALPLASLGRKDEAFAWLERGLRDHAPFMDNIHVFPGLEPLRADARFADIIARMEPAK